MPNDASTARHWQTGRLIASASLTIKIKTWTRILLNRNSALFFKKPYNILNHKKGEK